MADKKKPKPGPSTGGSSKSSVKKPKGTQPLTLGTGLRTGKISKKQQAGTRKVVGAIAAATPVGKAASVATRAAQTVANKAVIGKRTSKVNKAFAKKQRLAGKNAPKQPKYPSNLVSVKPKAGTEWAKRKGLEGRGKKTTKASVQDNAKYVKWKLDNKRMALHDRQMYSDYYDGTKNLRMAKGKNAAKYAKVKKIAKD